MRTLFILLGILGAGFSSLIILVTTGSFNIRADEPHHPLIYKALEIAKDRSIAEHTQDIIPPENLYSFERVARGAYQYEKRCAGCHLSPSTVSSELHNGLYPQPPDFNKKHDMYLNNKDLARDFSIIKHGIQSTAMPAWSKGEVNDEDIWDTIAFMNKINTHPEYAYRELNAAGEVLYKNKCKLDLPHVAEPIVLAVY